MASSESNPFIAGALQFGAQSDALTFLSGLSGKENIAHCTYLGVDIAMIHAHRDYVVSTYSKEWSSRYFEKSYQNVDPVITTAMHGILPFDWKRRDNADAAINHFFGEAAEFGVKRQGLSIPIRGAHGERALFSVNADVTDADWEAFKRDHLGNLTLMAYHFHLAIMDMECGPDLEKPTVSPREVEVLRWAAAGKSAWETGRILDLSSNTITAYLHSAACKLGAVNKTQAVAKALQKDILC